MELHYGNLIEQGKNGDFDVIIHGCNAFHTMGAGIARHIKTNFPEAYEADTKTVSGDRKKIGTFSEATVNIKGHDLTIINAYTQFNYGGGRDNFEYDSFPSLLQSIKSKYGDKKIGLPLIGCGLAGGDEQRILTMIKENFDGVNYKLVEIDTNRKLNYIEEVNLEAPKEYEFFFHLTSPFSNFHPSKFEYKDITFISNEQFMMYSKAKTFGDEITANKIINIFNEFMLEPGIFKSEDDKLCFQLASSFNHGDVSTKQILSDKDSIDAWNTIHKKMKQLGRGVKNYDDNIWDKKREKVVLFGAKLKFSQNLELKEKLMSTGDKLMVESSPYDKIWGIGLSANDAKSTPPEKWPGLNLLGKVLDQVKSEFKNELVKKPKP